ncbi:MAG: Zn-dependent protease with chaperone function, partial [Arenimonas sp.]
EDHRVFRVELAQPPKMWATHPANADRENNAKRNYIAADIDERSALLLFENVDQLKQEVTRKIFTGKLPAEVPINETLERLDKDFSRSFLDQRYRGVYLGRSIVRTAKTVDDLYGPESSARSVVDDLDLLYPESLSVQLDQLRDLQTEHATLLALQAGHLTTAGGVVRWRGDEIAKRDLPKVIASLDGEIKPIEQAVLQHDRDCRSAHLRAAKSLGRGWPEYLRSQLELLHYADHIEADLRDSQRILGQTVAVVTADRRVSENELRRVVAASNQLGGLLFEAHFSAGTVTLDERMREILGVQTLKELLGENFSLPAASSQNINEWLRVIDGWVDAGANAFSRLRNAALENLLRSEADVEAASRNNVAVDEAPAASKLPAVYPVLTPGTERVLSAKLSWWDRFQMAEGFFPTVARFAAAGSILGAVLLMGGSVGETKLSLFNGLGRYVSVEVDGVAYELAPNTSFTISMPVSNTHEITAKTLEGELIESFSADSETGASHYIYNVANAAA